jgi:AcrR family transcriptional regulator
MRTRSEARRQRILEEAGAVFREMGYEQASMNDIAERVGGSKATLYSYFPSKSALFVAVMSSSSAAAFEPVFTTLSSELPMVATIETFGRHYLEAVCADATLRTYRMAVAEAAGSDIGRLLYENGPLRGWTEVADFIRVHQAAGRLRADADAMQAAWRLRGLLEAGVWEPQLLAIRPGAPAPQADDLQAHVHEAVQAWLAWHGALAFSP